MYRTWILIIFIGMAQLPSSVYAETEEKGKSWKGAVADEDLVVVVNFLINNKGKEIVLAGENHTITGKEKLDVEINSLSCCDPIRFYKDISAYGKIRNFNFPSYLASMPADAIPEIDKNGEVREIKFEPKARKLWMMVIKQ